MRKLTGYIGAMIITFALAGSILLGYALNINGTDTVVNEYEKVTDVSGLYQHSDEKTYLEYNPATNYIGYEQLYSPPQTINNITDLGGNRLYYHIYDGENVNAYWNNSNWADGAFYNSGSVVLYSTTGDQYGNLVYPIVTGEHLIIYIYNPDSTKYIATITYTQNGVTNTTHSGNFTLSYNDDILTINLDGTTTITFETPWIAIPKNNGDYSVMVGTGKIGYFLNQNIYYDKYSTTANITKVDSYNGNTVYNLYSAQMAEPNYWFFVPKTVNTAYESKINYTESNRVNNYPFEYDYTTTTTTQTATVNLMSVSAADQFTTANGLRLGTGSNHINGINNHHFWAGGQFQIKTGVHEYKLSDIFSTLTIPTGTTTVLIDIDMGNVYQPRADVPVDPNDYYTPYMPVMCNTGINPELTSIYPTNNFMATENNQQNMNYGIYYPETGQVDIYEKRTGVKLWTSNINSSVVRFVDDNITTGTFEYNYEDTGNSGTSEISFNLSARSTPKLNITYTINGAITNTHYMDITKGVSIKSSNTGVVKWDNQYENGIIKILFRAENNTTTYQNELTISGNDIIVDYDGGHFYVTLNDNTRVDIGLWRNIVLDVDLINGNLNAIPVRTFNSYTNVITDNTVITIGDLVGAAPTNIINWEPTNKSLTFNVYSTDVFMDTYGQVMVNPTLNITDYFTDLNNFYRLKLYNFATYGDSMTINGETLNVVNNKIGYNGNSLELRDLTITYADNVVTIGDNHTSIELGNLETTNISMSGAWYFLTDLERGYTAQKIIYDWDWGTFIFDNTQFCIFYLGISGAALIIARRYCNLSIIDYAVLLVSIVIALGVQVIA